MAEFNIKTLIVITYFLCISFSYIGCSKKKDFDAKDTEILTKEKILKIANKEAKTFDFTLDESEVLYDVDRAEWRENLKFMAESDPNWPREYDLLNGRDYVIVLYRPKKTTVLGGVLWLFIDKKTGEVITYSLEM